MTVQHKKLLEANLTAGYVAKRSGVKVSALHFYETEGLSRSWRSSGNQRRCKPDVLKRVALIKAAQTMGVTLEAIKQTLATLPDKRTPTKKDGAATNSYKASFILKVFLLNLAYTINSEKVFWRFLNWYIVCLWLFRDITN